MNKAILMGRLTQDPKVLGESEKKVARYTLAVDRRYSKGEEKQTDFINIVVFAKGAEFAEKFFKKGMKVAVTGRIQTGSYTNKEGAKVYTFDVVAEEQEFCESKGSSEGAAPSSTPSESSDGDFMSVPAGADDNFPF